MRKFIGIDIGGTNIKFGVVDEKGSIVTSDKTKTEAKLGGAYLCEKVLGIVDSLQKSYDVAGVGISTAGVVDSKKGEIVFANSNLPNYIGTNWNTLISERFHLPVYVLNDVHAAGSAEAWIGAGKNCENFLCVAVGTGIGGCMFINKKPYFGPHFRAAALGYMKTGGSQIYEKKASTSALVRNITAITGDLDVDGKNAFLRSREGNKIYKDELSKWFNELSLGIANCIFCFDPELIIIGGAISNEGKPLIDSIETSLKNYVPQEFLSNIKFATAKCTNNAGMIGAVYGLINSGKIK